MKNPLTIENDLEFLYPPFGAAILRVLSTANRYSRNGEGAAKYAGFMYWKGFETYRSPARQLQLYQEGITPVKVSTYHSVGLAADIVWYDKNGKPHWDGSAAMWEILGHCASAEGLIWGGNWRSRDCVHIQCTLIQRVRWVAKSRKYLRGLGYLTA